MATNQEGRQASFRAISSTSTDYNGDSLAAFLAEGAAAGNDYNGTFVDWLQIRLSSSDTNLNDLKQAFAESLGFDSWGAINTFGASFPTSGQQMWLDAVNSTITEISGSVSGWDSVSPATMDASQTIELSQPITDDQTINSLNVIDFDGTKFMDHDGFAVTSGITYAFVIEPDITTIMNIFSNKSTLVRLESGAVKWLADTAGGSVDTGVVYSADTPFILLITQTGTSYNIYVDGTSVKSGTTNALNNTAQQNRIGDWFASNEFDGSFGEISTWNRALSSSEITSVHNTWNSKWAIY